MGSASHPRPNPERRRSGSGFMRRGSIGPISCSGGAVTPRLRAGRPTFRGWSTPGRSTWRARRSPAGNPVTASWAWSAAGPTPSSWSSTKTRPCRCRTASTWSRPAPIPEVVPHRMGRARYAGPARGGRAGVAARRGKRPRHRHGADRAAALAPPSLGTSRTPAKLEHARALGLDIGIDTSGGGFREAVVEPVNLVIDVLGGPAFADNLADPRPPWPAGDARIPPGLRR